ncbi:MAG: HEPN domain-containing protein [Moorellales bacterium]
MRRTPLEEGKRWLDQAREDLKWARRLTEEGAYYLACFLSQQVAEKALKAFLYARGEEMVAGHSVAVLGQRAGRYEPLLEQKRSSWALLDGYYVPTRYPNGLPDGIPAGVYNRKAASDAVELAADAVDTVARLLGL